MTISLFFVLLYMLLFPMTFHIFIVDYSCQNKYTLREKKFKAITFLSHSFQIENIFIIIIVAVVASMVISANAIKTFFLLLLIQKKKNKISFLLYSIHTSSLSRLCHYMYIIFIIIIHICNIIYLSFVICYLLARCCFIFIFITRINNTWSK
jgi:hypothetical protein